LAHEEGIIGVTLINKISHFLKLKKKLSMAIINTILYERKIRDEFQIVVCNNITILKVLKTTLQTCQKKNDTTSIIAHIKCIIFLLSQHKSDTNVIYIHLFSSNISTYGDEVA
jgi:hypothetical protein